MRPLWFPYLTRSVFTEGGVNEAYIVTHKSIARENSDESPYLIPNEWIASNIAQFLRLPIPPFSLIRRDTHKGMFASLRYQTRGDDSLMRFKRKQDTKDLDAVDSTKTGIGYARLGQKKEDIIGRYGKPTKETVLASGIESLQFQHGHGCTSS